MTPPSTAVLPWAWARNASPCSGMASPTFVNFGRTIWRSTSSFRRGVSLIQARVCQDYLKQQKLVILDTMASTFRDVDPRALHVPSSRPTGADPAKLQRQIARFGAAAIGMPPPWVYEGTDGE